MMYRLPAFFLLIALSALAGARGAQAEEDPVRAAMEDGRLEEARTLLEGPTHGLPEGERLERLTEVCTALGDYAAGVKYGKKAIGKSPESSNAHYQYALAVRTKMQSVSVVKAMFSVGTYKKALRKARELDPDNLDAREEEIGFLYQAPGVAGGDVDRARALAKELQSLDPKRGRNMAIQIELGNGDPERATALFQEALAADPEDGRLRTRFGYHLQRQERFREADAEFSRLQGADDPRLARGALYQRARTRILGRYEPEQAIRFMNEYIESLSEDEASLPSRSSAYWRIGNAHEQLGQWTEARRAYTTSLKLNPENEEAEKSLKALRH